MNDTIYLRLGTAEHLTLTDLIDSLKDFRGVLLDLDATISRDKEGSMIWEVVSLEKNSPALVGVAPRLKKGHEDISSIVENQFIENARLLSEQGDRTKYLSDAALSKIQRLAYRSERLGPLEVYLNGDGPIRAKADLSPVTYKNVRELTSPKYFDYGSIYGSLDSISVHRNYEFRVWNEENNKSVLCTFEESKLEQVKSYLQKKVVVTGMIKSNAAGSPISIEVEDLEVAPELVVPTIDEMIGLVPNITDGLSLKEYMKRLSDE